MRKQILFISITMYSQYISQKNVLVIWLSSNNFLLHPDMFDGEIHVKIGGDHGGGSFKWVYQICNVAHSNSNENTVVFNLFEAKDHRSNLKLTFFRFIEQVDRLQSMEWKYVII